MLVAPQLIANTDNRVIVGLGVTGLSCARHLRRIGVKFSVVDTRANPPGIAQLREAMPEVPLYTGEIPAGVISASTELVVSPGVALDEPLVRDAIALGATVLGDIDLFLREAQAPVVGITGSNAKSTVTELLGQMLRDAGLNVGVGGNLGTPALDLLAPEREMYVLELSSFQLERAGVLDLAVATILNVSADHLDRHGDMSVYQQAKQRIFNGCRTAVVNPGDPLSLPLKLPADVERVSWLLGEPELGGFGLRVVAGQEFLCRGFENILQTSELAMAGRHNIANALAALALGNSVGLSVKQMAMTLKQFRGLPHRSELVGSIAGVRYVNDSKGTNVGATQAALEGMAADANIVLIAGGQSKKANFSPLVDAIQKHCKAVVLIGEDAALIDAALAGVVETVLCESMQAAVNTAAAMAQCGDVVLLSPACASFDMFDGYEARGDAFCAAVTALTGVAE